MSSDDSIEYRGPDPNFRPHIGGNRSADRRPKFNSPADRSYADRELLQNALQLILSEASALVVELEAELASYALPVTAVDERLIAAQKEEWPAALGAVPNRISYRFYKALGVRSTTSATYIRSRYEDGMRDVTGTDAVDVLALVNLITGEASLVLEFLPLFIGDVNDTSEYRTLELFQDWTDSARLELEDLRKVRAQADRLTLSDTEINSVTPREARNAQATFKVKLNATNRELVEALSFIRRTWSDHAGTFYGRFLGPALRYRLSVGSQTQPLTGSLASDMRSTNKVLDSNLSVMQADQLRRNLIFDAKVREATTKIRYQDAYRNYISQLTVKGRPLPVAAPGLAVQAVEPPEEIAYFTDEEVQAHITPPAPAAFTGRHGSLTGLDDLDAHRQYLLRDGDVLSGDLFVDDGIRIDGVDVNLHAHTGGDGTSRVHGSNIEWGTITPDVIDHTQTVPTPTELRLISMTQRVAPPGVTLFDVLLAWDVPTPAPNHTYEVQLAPID